MLRRFALFLAVLLVACGGPAPAPKGPDSLKVGHGKGDAPVAVSPPDARDASETEARVPVFGDDPVRGGRDAYVTLVLFSDFQCPFCSRFEPSLERAREEFGDNLRIVWKNQPLPFHQYAKTAALVGYGVFATKGADAFWQFHDMAFRRQQLMNEETIKQWGLASGLTQADLDVGLAPGSAWAQKVDRDVQLAQKIGAQGTPMSYINGTLLSGAQPYEKLKQTIETELAKAKALEARGTPRSKIYKLAAAENYKEPAPQRDDDDDDDKPDTTVWKVPVGSSPVRGPATALVTIVEFSDFQCPYCKRVEPTLEQIRKQYGSKVRFVWKDEPLPFHPRAVPAANLAREARQQKGDSGFWDVHDKLFASQPKLEDEDLESVAKAAGLDAKKAIGAVKNQAHKKGIDADVDLGDDVQASGTPHFFINGRRLVGAQPFDKFKTIIDEEMAKAEALVRAGTKENAVYEATIKNGRAAPEPEQKSVKANPSAPFRGPANAPVVIQEFSDFQCPFCNRVEATLDQITKDYPQKVKLVWRDMPLPMHPDAPLAAEAAREAFAQKGNTGFQAMRELLFKNQQSLKRGDLEGYAVKIGLDLAKFNKALDDHKHQAAVDADADAGHAAGISGTPAFLVGPYFISGAQPYAKFKKAIERVLAGPAPAPPTVAAGATTTTPSGLQITDIFVGTGPAVKTGDKVSVHYVGTLKDGTEFDSSKKHNQPFGFTVGNGQVIKGWDQGLVGMKVGGKRKLVIPPDLAYGDRGAAGVIPPKSTLTFEIELLSIK